MTVIKANYIFLGDTASLITSVKAPLPVLPVHPSPPSSSKSQRFHYNDSWFHHAWWQAAQWRQPIRALDPITQTHIYKHPSSIFSTLTQRTQSLLFFSFQPIGVNSPTQSFVWKSLQPLNMKIRCVCACCRI